MRGTRHLAFGSFIMAAANFAVPSIAYAQDAAATEPATIPEIVVTAQKREQRLSYVPISINNASGEELQNLGVSRTDDLAMITPGFTAAQSGSIVYSLRGLGLNEATLGVLPSVSVYGDEASLPFSFMAQGAILDLERVEVLKGPRGLFWPAKTRRPDRLILLPTSLLASSRQGCGRPTVASTLSRPKPTSVGHCRDAWRCVETVPVHGRGLSP